MKPWVKFPELRTKVVSPSANDCSSTFTPAHAVRTTFSVLYGRPRRSTTRNVSDVELGADPAISQKRCPNRLDELGGFPGLISFSIRSVARPVNGAGLLGSGVVE